MNFLEALRMSWQAVTANKIRAGLTVLGISVGIFSIIAAMTAVTALQQSISENSNFLGGNTLFVQKSPAISFGPRSEKIRKRRNITYAELSWVKPRIKQAVAVGIEDEFDVVQVTFGKEKTNPNVDLIGGDESYAVNNNRIVSEGRDLSAGDVVSARKVVILGMDVVDKLFPNITAVGQTVRVDGLSFEVIGIYEAKGSQFGQSQDNEVTIPITTALNVHGSQWQSLGLSVSAPSAEDVEATRDEITGLMRTVRKVKPGEENDFEIFSNEAIAETFGKLTSVVTLVTLPIALISLIAAGIGIMNIMLVSVTERTKEIGTRKALGATKRNLILQFLLEAIMLCLIGGVLGILGGVAVGNVAALLLKSSAVFPVGWAIFGLAMCSLTGLIAGLYPAFRAAQLDPIEALRYE